MIHIMGFIVMGSLVSLPLLVAWGLLDLALLVSITLLIVTVIGVVIGFAHAFWHHGSTPWEILSDPEGSAIRAYKRMQDKKGGP